MPGHDLPPSPSEQSREMLSAAISALHTPDFFPRLTGYMQSLTPFSGIFVTRLHATEPPWHIYDNVRAETRALVVDQYLDTAYLLDPFYNAYLSGSTHCVDRLRDVAPDHFTRSTYYKRYYGHLNLRDEIGILIDMPDGSAIFFSIGRHGNEPRFGHRALHILEQELGVLGALTRKHLLHSPRNTAMEKTPETLASALARFGKDVLTAREQEVASLILRGHSSASISTRTGIAEGTVKIHRKNLYRKLGISSQSELFARFLRTMLA